MKRSKGLLTFLALSGILMSGWSQDLVWSEEAENGILEGTADINQGCDNASNGQFVRLYSDNANGLTFNNVNVDEAGTYRLSVDYYYDGSQPLEVLVNGSSVGVYTFPSSIWCYQGTASVLDIGIELNSGSNTLKFKPANGSNAPFLDKFELYGVAPTEVNLKASSTRVLPGTEIQLQLETTDILPESKWVRLAVSGIATEDYHLADETVTIPSGSTSASTSISLLNKDASHGTEIVVNIESAETGIPVGELSALSIRIVDHPEVLYVSSSVGNDLNSGTDPSEPCKSLAKVSSFLLFPGDSILFKAGDIFPGQLRINGSGDESTPVFIGRYGEGDDPLIDGAGDDGGAFASAVLIENQDHIRIQHLAIRNDRRTPRLGESDGDAYGIQVLNSGDAVMNSFHFSDLAISEIFAISTEDVEFNGLQTAAIQFRTLRSDDPGNLRNISDVLVENCYITNTTKAGIWSRHNGVVGDAGNDSINRNMNLVFRNNHFFETGGSGIILSKSYNCLLENNIFEYSGSDADPRMAKRGSGAWFWSCRNVIAQYNKSLHIRGPADSYGMHIDFGNENVILQYNYSEDSEGGFVEILGDNINSVYRFNVSVNDGSRERKGNSIWVSDYAGSGTPGIKSDNNYIYNNTIYVDAAITPDIMITGKNTFVYNNIFYATGDAVIGQTVDLNGSLDVSNNLFYGSVTTQFKVLDDSPVEGDPLFSDPGTLNSDGYKLEEGSAAMNAGLSFTEPQFPQAGKGIFQDVSAIPEEDHFGNPVSIETGEPHIGAFAGLPVGLSQDDSDIGFLMAYFDHKANLIKVSWMSQLGEELSLSIFDISGRILFSEEVTGLYGLNRKSIFLNNKELKGIAIVVLRRGSTINAIKVPVL